MSGNINFRPFPGREGWRTKAPGLWGASWLTSPCRCRSPSRAVRSHRSAGWGGTSWREASSPRGLAPGSGQVGTKCCQGLVGSDFSPSHTARLCLEEGARLFCFPAFHLAASPPCKASSLWARRGSGPPRQSIPEELVCFVLLSFVTALNPGFC